MPKIKTSTAGAAHCRPASQLEHEALRRLMAEAGVRDIAAEGGGITMLPAGLSFILSFLAVVPHGRAISQ